MSQAVEHVEQDIRSFVVENFLFGDDGSKIANDASFLDNGIIDSTGVLELVAFIEEKYGIAVADDDLVPDNLDSISSIKAFVERKRAN